MLQNALHSSKSLNDISSVVVQIPKLPIVALVGPPERILLQNLELLKVGPHTPTLVVSQCVTILLEQCIDSRNTSVPRVLHNARGWLITTIHKIHNRKY